MSRTIDVKGTVQEWVDLNDSSLRIWIVEACEVALAEYTDTADVVILNTESGLTRFVIKGVDKIRKALKISMEHFVKIEEYELAARARDCIYRWEEKNRETWQNQ